MKTLFLTLSFIALVQANSKVITGKSYKIISTFNHHVLDFEGKCVYNGVPVIPLPWKEIDTRRQVWEADKLPSGVFILRNLADKKHVLAWSKKVLEDRHQHREGENQQWWFENVTPNSFTFYIRNQWDTKYITLNDDEITVSMQSKNVSNIKQRWLFAEA